MLPSELKDSEMAPAALSWEQHGPVASGSEPPWMTHSQASLLEARAAMATRKMHTYFAYSWMLNQSREKGTQCTRYTLRAMYCATAMSPRARDSAPDTAGAHPGPDPHRQSHGQRVTLALVVSHAAFIASPGCATVLSSVPSSRLDTRACCALWYHPQYVPRPQRAPRSFLIAGAAFISFSYATIYCPHPSTHAAGRIPTTTPTSPAPAAAALHRAHRVRTHHKHDTHHRRCPLSLRQPFPIAHAIYVASPFAANVFSVAPPSAQSQHTLQLLPIIRAAFVPSLRARTTHSVDLPSPLDSLPASTSVQSQHHLCTQRAPRVFSVARALERRPRVPHIRAPLGHVELFRMSLRKPQARLHGARARAPCQPSAIPIRPLVLVLVPVAHGTLRTVAAVRVCAHIGAGVEQWGRAEDRRGGQGCDGRARREDADTTGTPGSALSPPPILDVLSAEFLLCASPAGIRRKGGMLRCQCPPPALPLRRCLYWSFTWHSPRDLIPASVAGDACTMQGCKGSVRTPDITVLALFVDGVGGEVDDRAFAFSGCPSSDCVRICGLPFFHAARSRVTHVSLSFCYFTLCRYWSLLASMQNFDDVRPAGERSSISFSGRNKSARSCLHSCFVV
ncbi:hypothetical protein B0H14DRAFT_3900798 [Mycena olivaceomarginata]|nr:hypothetical protein B0H14DRAFT_3900798 [Mycena olivaceomarginata]